MTKTRIKKYTYFIGIDVSKNELDYAVMRGDQLLFHREGKNEPAHILAFIDELKLLPGFTLGKSVFCMEHTGYYCNPLLMVLKKLKGNAVLDNPFHIQRSIGMVRGKDDRSDAIRIALYAQKNAAVLKLWVNKRIALAKLAGLITLRRRLIVMLNALNTPLEEQDKYIDNEHQQQYVGLCSGSIATIKADLKQVDAIMEKLINADERLARLKKIILSVPGVGPVTASQLIISTNEFLTISCPRKFACYAGVAPFTRESGLVIRRKKISPIANRKVKTLLHLCALNVIRHDPRFKAYYERKTTVEHKPKLVVINAVRNKLLRLIFSCVNQDKLYTADYRRDMVTATGSADHPGLEAHCMK